MAITSIFNKTEMGDSKPGLFYIYSKVDFAKYPMAAIGDDFKLAGTKDGWLFLGAFFRMLTVSTSAGTVDVGTAQDGVELDTAIDVSGANTAWAAMTPTYAAPVEVTADGHIWLDCNTAAIEDGVLELMFIVMAAPGDDESPSSAVE